jgi:LuxR family transcriptional regulator, maltose regulon positive regulatory protein
MMQPNWTNSGHIPSRAPNPVPRTLLQARLIDGLLRKLSLISAPAGFGKTDLLVSFAARCQRPLAWISLTTADNDPVRFFSSLHAALQTIHTESGQILGSALQASPPLPVEALLTALTNDIASVPSPFVLILDDLHLVNDDRIHKSLIALLTGTFQHLHMVVGTRVDPPFPLARLRAHGELVEIRAADLRFTVEEAAAFFVRRTGLELSRSQIAVLQARTEGWIAGLQLASVAMQSVPNEAVDTFIAGFTGSHRYIMDYLTDEVLRLQPDWIEDFLLKTSILDHLSAPLCNALLADEDMQPVDSQQMLETIESLNLFLLPLDAERRWYRYHQLFADLLRHRLAQRDPQKMRVLHRRASGWFSQDADANNQSRSVESALLHAQSTGDMQLVAQLLDRFSELLWQRGEYIRLGFWIEQLTNDLRAGYPRLGILLSWMQFASGRLPLAVETLAGVQRNLAEGTHPPDLQGKASVVQAYLAVFSGNASGAIGAAQQALELLPFGPSAWRTSAATAMGDAYALSADPDSARQAYRQAIDSSQPEQHPYLALNASVKLVMLLRQAGELAAALEMADRQIALAGHTGMAKSALAGTLLAVKGEILCERQAYEEARQLSEQGVRLCEQGGHIGLLGWSTLYYARVLLSTGDLDGLERLLDSFINLGFTTQIPPWIVSPIEAMHGLLWIRRGEYERVVAWIEDRGLKPDDAAVHTRPLEYLVLAEYLLETGKNEAAAQLLERVIQAGSVQRSVTLLIQALLILVRHTSHQEDQQSGVNALTQALKLAAPGNFIQTFIDAGPQIIPWLQDERIRTSFPDYSRRLLIAFDRAYPEANELIDPLSARELEVLKHIARGDRNADIASALVISQNTVLFHTKNIYGKLNVNNRTQAIARARQLGLI